MIKKVGCIEIPVSDMRRAVGFYESVMGLKKTYEHPVWTSFDVGGITLALAVSGTKTIGKNRKKCTSCSLCVLRYAATNRGENKGKPIATSVVYLEVEEIDKMFNLLKDQDVNFITEPKDQEWGGRTAIMLDPDNNILVLSGTTNSD